MGVFARLAGCAFLIYTVYQLFSTDTDLSESLKYIIAGAMLLLAAVVIGLTVWDFYRNLRAGTYSEATYWDADLEEYKARKAAEAASGDAAGETLAANAQEEIPTEVVYDYLYENKDNAGTQDGLDDK
jgi:hypothetical protein